MIYKEVSPAIWWATFALVSAIVLTPLFVVTFPPLHDYPFHLARAGILAGLPTSEFLQSHYVVGSFLLPNVGMDVIMLGLTKEVPVPAAGQLLLALIHLLILTGTVAVHAALHRRLSLWPLLAAFFLYNWIFYFGFLSYLLGVGLMLWATAIWITLREKFGAWRLIWGMVSALGLLFCHLEAFGLFALIIGGMELQRASLLWRYNRRLALQGLVLGAIPFAVALSVFALVSPTAGEAEHVMAYQGTYHWKPVVAYRSLITPIARLDPLAMLPILLGVAAALWARCLTLALPMAVPLILLLLAFVVMPFEIFGALYADARLPIAILFVAIASTGMVDFGARRMWLFGLGALGLLSLRSAVIARDFIDTEPRITAFTDAFRQIPAGATLYAATAGTRPMLDYRGAAGLALWHPPLKHVVSLASIGQDVFVPATWSNPTQQPMRVLDGLAPIKQFQGSNPIEIANESDLNDAVRQIATLRPLLERQLRRSVPSDYLLLLQPGEFHGTLPADAVAVAGDTDFVLLRLKPRTPASVANVSH